MLAIYIWLFCNKEIPELFHLLKQKQFMNKIILSNFQSQPDRAAYADFHNQHQRRDQQQDLQPEIPRHEVDRRGQARYIRADRHSSATPAVDRLAPSRRRHGNIFFTIKFSP